MKKSLYRLIKDIKKEPENHIMMKVKAATLSVAGIVLSACGRSVDPDESGGTDYLLLLVMYFVVPPK